jgi:glycine dehydrogenase subunit 2
LPFLPIPIVGYDGNTYRWLNEADYPQSIGRLLAHSGNIGVILRAYVYARLLGREGMPRVAEFSTLNANYLQARLGTQFDLAFPQRRASHEFILTLKRQAKQQKVTAMDFAKRLLDKGFHAPTAYFPLLVPECFLIEPTETEDKQTLDWFVEAFFDIQQEAESTPETLKKAPYHAPVRRLDEVKAAKKLDIFWKKK